MEETEIDQGGGYGVICREEIEVEIITIIY